MDWSSCGVRPANGPAMRVCAVNVPLLGGLTPNCSPYFWVLVEPRASPSATLSTVTTPAAPPPVMPAELNRLS